MQIEIGSFEPTFMVSFTQDEIAWLMDAARNHPDLVCREAALSKGLLTQIVEHLKAEPKVHLTLEEYCLLQHIASQAKHRWLFNEITRKLNRAYEVQNAAIRMTKPTRTGAAP